MAWIKNILIKNMFSIFGSNLKSNFCIAQLEQKMIYFNNKNSLQYN